RALRRGALDAGRPIPRGLECRDLAGLARGDGLRARPHPQGERGMTAARLPGDPSPDQALERMIRVDHAGEYGAVRIYEGQLAVLGKSVAGSVIREMAEQERRHL